MATTTLSNKIENFNLETLQQGWEKINKSKKLPQLSEPIFSK